MAWRVKEILELQDEIVKFFTLNNCEIYCDYPRNNLIRQFNTKLFNSTKKDKNEFYNMAYDTDTKNRLLLTKKIKVFLKTNSKKSRELIKLLCSFFFVYIKHENTTIFGELNYICKMIIASVKPYMISTEVEFCSSEILKYPPHKSQCECNMLVMNNTNTYYCCDHDMTELSKKYEETRIFEETQSMTTALSFYSYDRDESMSNENKCIREKRCLEVLTMMLEGWQFNESLYFNVRDASREEVCVICLNPFIEKEKIIQMNCCSGEKLCIKCFRQYIRSQFDVRITPKCLHNGKSQKWTLVTGKITR
jgi:hypothetical protein